MRVPDVLQKWVSAHAGELMQPVSHAARFGAMHAAVAVPVFMSPLSSSPTPTGGGISSSRASGEDGGAAGLLLPPPLQPQIIAVMVLYWAQPHSATDFYMPLPASSDCVDFLARVASAAAASYDAVTSSTNAPQASPQVRRRPLALSSPLRC